MGSSNLHGGNLLVCRREDDWSGGVFLSSRFENVDYQSKKKEGHGNELVKGGF